MRHSAICFVTSLSACLLLSVSSAGYAPHNSLPGAETAGRGPGAAPRAQSLNTAERQKRAAREHFRKNFSGLQNVGYKLLREHEAGSLSPQKLARGVKTVNKHARTLRGMLLLGELEEPIEETNEPIDTAGEFDISIRRLARLIYTFAHNPLHQERRVFDTVQARRALIDLETIIVLSKIIEDQAGGYLTR